MNEPERNSRDTKLDDILKGLIGKSITRVVGGGAAGSIIGIYFSNVSSTTDIAADEWYLAVECSWRIDNADGPFASSIDGNEPDGFMMQGLNSLWEMAVVEIEVLKPALDLTIFFSQGKRLSVFCDVIRDGICWYLLTPQNLEVSVEPAGTLLIE